MLIAAECKGCKHDRKNTCPVLDLSKGFRPCKGPFKKTKAHSSKRRTK